MMNILYILLICVVSFVVHDFGFWLVGHFLYAIGIKKIGHSMVAMSIAGTFGKAKNTRKWLHMKCPRKSCERCRLWSCPVYEGSISIK